MVDEARRMRRLQIITDFGGGFIDVLFILTAVENQGRERPPGEGKMTASYVLVAWAAITKPCTGWIITKISFL